jgi:hypothetical protein
MESLFTQAASYIFHLMKGWTLPEFEGLGDFDQFFSWLPLSLLISALSDETE